MGHIKPEKYLQTKTIRNEMTNTWKQVAARQNLAINCLSNCRQLCFQIENLWTIVILSSGQYAGMGSSQTVVRETINVLASNPMMSQLPKLGIPITLRTRSDSIGVPRSRTRRLEARQVANARIRSQRMFLNSGVRFRHRRISSLRLHNSSSS
jgi:hypothetical protein